MPLIPDAAVFHKRLATLPLATYQVGETVLAAGSRSGRLLILRKGAVAIVKEAIEIAKCPSSKFLRQRAGQMEGGSGSFG
jgi:signal-transduction protein with cAMP-binding, CBS, and nucleotidyltransferase domain